LTLKTRLEYGLLTGREPCIANTTKLAGNYVTNSLTHSFHGAESVENDNHSYILEVPRLLWIPKVHYRVHNSPPLILTLSHMHPVHIPPPILFP